MATTAKIQEHAEVILEEAREINKTRACEESISDEEDFCESEAPETV